jgi:PhzF family phenazine biosynthesis protein
MLISVHHLDVFAREPGGGNPCPVVIDADQLSADEMQAVAAYFGEETGFVLHDADGGLRLRFFVPRHELSMCVHATVAAVTVLAAAEGIDGGTGPVRTALVRTASGQCRVSWDDGLPPEVSVEQQAPVIGPPLAVARELADALRVSPDALDDILPIRSVSVSRAKLIVPVRTAEAVRAVDPDLDLLWEICRRADTTGAYVFAPHPDGSDVHVVARQFPVDAGYPEDPATGVAAGALVVYLADRARSHLDAAGSDELTIDIDQGDAMGRPSRLAATARVDSDQVLRSVVSGRATLRRVEDLDLARVRAGRH